MVTELYPFLSNIIELVKFVKKDYLDQNKIKPDFRDNLDYDLRETRQNWEELIDSIVKLETSQGGSDLTQYQNLKETVAI